MEVDRLEALRLALANGRLRRAFAADDTPVFEFPPDAPPETPAVLGSRKGQCVFHDDSCGSACRVQHSLGHDTLPLACRQFPRISVADPRGVSITLSHYCPTAAGLLDDRTPVTIVEQPAAFPAGGEYDALDVARGLPPQRNSRRLLDWDDWWRLEAASVAMLADDGQPIDDRMARLRATVAPQAEAPLRVPDAARLTAAVTGAVPHELRTAMPRPWGPAPSEAALGRLLASHAFASWLIHLGDGLATWLCAIEAVLALVRAGWSVADVELVVRHLADPTELARGYSAAMNGYV